MKLFKNIKLYLLAFILLSISCTVKSQNDEPKLPKSYIAFHTNEPVHIDGKAEESSWKSVNWSDDFIDIQGVKKPKYRTRMKMMWDDTYLYFYAELEEPHIWANLKKRDTVIFYNNDFEIFIDPDGDGNPYYEFEMNALNTIWDLVITKPYRDFGHVFTNWDYKNAKTAVHINGTLNDPSDVDKMWSVEIAFPWKAINETFDDKIIAPKGKTWRINFSRVNWDYELINNAYQRKKDKTTGKYLHEYNWVWSPQEVINMHQPERWGYVYFSEKNVGEKDVFVYGKDEVLKLKIYEIHRSLRNHYATHNVWDKALIPSSIMVNDKEIKINSEINIIGYTLSLKSPFTEKTYFMSENGKLITN